MLHHVAMDFAIMIPLKYERDFLSLHHRSSSAKKPGSALGEKTFARPSLGFFSSACLPLFCGRNACRARLFLCTTHRTRTGGSMSEAPRSRAKAMADWLAELMQRAPRSARVVVRYAPPRRSKLQNESLANFVCGA